MRLVAEVWSEALKVECVRPTDGFFQLGGHSLAALRTLHMLRDRLSVGISLRDLMEARNLADFTEVIQQALDSGAPTRPRITLTGRRGTR
jgi:acyl carrier protein